MKSGLDAKPLFLQDDMLKVKSKLSNLHTFPHRGACTVNRNRQFITFANPPFSFTPYKKKGIENLITFNFTNDIFNTA